MRVCLVLEGSYPYVRGGVSSWTHDFIQRFSDLEFVIWAIDAQKERRGIYKYELPSNVVAIHEVFLDEAIESQMETTDKNQLSDAEMEAMLSLMKFENPDWARLFECFNAKQTNAAAFLRSEQFLRVFKQMCAEKYPHSAFYELFYTFRSMLLPLLYILKQPVPEADVYHALAAGYSGVLGSMAAWKNKNSLIVTEHGIYSREREEEILRSRWVKPNFKDMWIAFFHMLSRCVYDNADEVTSLYDKARQIQIEIGCPADKTSVINNGVHCDKFEHIPSRKREDGYIDIGAVVRIAPIKDIRTMICAYAELRHQMNNVRLHILGDVDDEEYDAECKALIAQMETPDVYFHGTVDVVEYLAKFDFTILTSISESQPLAVVEAMAAGKSCVVTDVGSCRTLVEGAEGDKLGRAGLCIPPMHPEALTEAMMYLCTHPEERLEMGAVGRKRANESYTSERMIKQYKKVYERVSNGWNRI